MSKPSIHPNEMLSEEWVKKMTSSDDGFPGANGADQAPMPSKDEVIAFLQREVWKWRYVVRFMEVGFELQHALAHYEGGADSHDYSQDPTDAANEALQCYEDDGDLA